MYPSSAYSGIGVKMAELLLPHMSKDDATNLLRELLFHACVANDDEDEAVAIVRAFRSHGVEMLPCVGPYSHQAAEQKKRKRTTRSSEKWRDFMWKDETDDAMLIYLRNKATCLRRRDRMRRICGRIDLGRVRRVCASDFG